MYSALLLSHCGGHFAVESKFLVVKQILNYDSPLQGNRLSAKC